MILRSHIIREATICEKRNQQNKPTNPHMLSTPPNRKQLPWNTAITLAAALCLFTIPWTQPAQAQTLKLRFPFDDAGPGTNTTSDTSTSGSLAVTLTMETQTANTGV